ncbi:AraC family transcriptional regulator [Paracoccus litorisediminis]|uniref:Helix-turn-helix domain-containing protein n=1 Tax=Paracoccus litorisediminis TaxID=2006130 RepID=A0A844HNB3_9RHOB|nr:AraC family transcriptional regulator [Paracoccus litorisediminis]MTH61813.1 helix-turn-helix domain-containing protein [Paracoccus litorisediminis]
MVFQQLRLIRTGALEGFRDYVFMLGGDPDPILRSAGIDPATLNAPETQINLAHYVSALNLAAEATGTPAFGLLLSQRQSLDNVGAVGYLARHAPTLQVALEELSRFLRLHDGGTFLEVDQSDDTTLIGLKFSGAEGLPGIQRVELAMGLLLKFLRSVMAENWTATAVHFEHKRPASPQYHERLFRCPIYYEQPFTAVELPSGGLQTRPKNADHVLFSILRGHIERLNAELGSDLVGQLRRIIHNQLENGPPRLDEAAAALGLSRHVLQRRLKDFGTSFQTLQQSVRFEAAQRYLAETDLPLVEISGILSFSEAAVFTRTFQRLAGMTPSEWRRENRIR